ncbi:MAG: prefoldin subunit alpha [Candidatus Aenigmarchaeota archaeon]|nr:prefoldin subunit alpha [Candidatus Aenigmarchaeota archaeon]NIP40112.1 prefoldin subunit alpha [Candidatus Aenigmarchaeota archaeon]NIQ18189.1 prefoldin subunit alpha [Candidatus Aenigmarchaeota archaeon]NIS72946.1 prefoldin subunit alpha [Candidatus Aenigmarchaeota archaeon]
MSEEKLQEKYVLYQLLQQNLESLREQLELVERQFMEIKTTQEVLKDLKKGKVTNDVLIPLGSGCYGKGKVTDLKTFLINLGANVMANKTLESAGPFLEEREKELEKAGKEIQEQMAKTANQINETAMEIQELARKRK